MASINPMPIQAQDPYFSHPIAGDIKEHKANAGRPETVEITHSLTQEYTTTERIGRALKAVAFIILTLGLGFFSSNFRNNIDSLFTDKEYSFEATVLVSKEGYNNQKADNFRKQKVINKLKLHADEKIIAKKDAARKLLQISKRLQKPPISAKLAGLDQLRRRVASLRRHNVKAKLQKMNARLTLKAGFNQLRKKTTKQPSPTDSKNRYGMDADFQRTVEACARRRRATSHKLPNRLTSKQMQSLRMKAQLAATAQS